VPSGPAGVRMSPVPWPGTASVGTPDRSARCEMKGTVRDVLAEGDPVHLLEHATIRPLGPQATISLRNVVPTPAR
jgi:hypothetical protein